MKMDNYGLYIILVAVLGVSSAILSGILALKSIREEDKFQQELAEANRKLANQADETRKLLRGEGYAKFSLYGSGNEKVKAGLGEYLGILYNDTDYPQYGITVVIRGAHAMKDYYLGKMNDYHDFDVQRYHREGQRVTVPEIYPHSMHFINEFKYELTNSHAEMIELSYASQSARVIQQVIVQKGLGQCTYGMRVWMVETDEESWHAKIIKEINPWGKPIPWDEYFIPVDKRRMMHPKKN